MNKSREKRNKKQDNLAGWDAVLLDIENDIETLEDHRTIVKRKIDAGEPWPGSDGYKVTQNESATQR
ncbi:MAG TPA: hypothetical protein VIB39_11385 [Candidatus Angelobacter sp.]|jgi:hypothetical protein